MSKGSDRLTFMKDPLIHDVGSSDSPELLMCICLCTSIYLNSEMLVEPQHCVEKAVGLRVHSRQRMSIFWKP